MRLDVRVLALMVLCLLASACNKLLGNEPADLEPRGPADASDVPPAPPDAVAGADANGPDGGADAHPSDACEAGSARLLSDPESCGACGHVCRNDTMTGPGLCRNGECESFLITTELVYANNLIADEAPNGYLYFTTTLSVDGIVGRVPKRGGASADVIYHVDGGPEDRPAGLALDDTRVYWGTSNGDAGRYGRVHWANRNGTAHGSIGMWDGPLSLVVNRGTLYWTNRGDSDVLLRISTADLGALPDGGTAVTPQVMYSVPTPETENVLGVVTDSISFGNVFFCMRSGVHRVNKQSLVDDRLGSIPCDGLALDSTNVYYARDGIVYRHDAVTASRAEERVVDLHLGADGADAFTTVNLFDGRYLYVTHFDREDGRIYRMNVDGSSPLLLASKIQMPSGISVDSVAIYWASQASGEIRKVWK